MQTVTAFHDLIANVALSWVSSHTGIGPDSGEWYAAATNLAEGFATAAVACAGLIVAGIRQVLANR